ncbi:hypothetical protein HKCCE2091_13250 [Rhodobacterales bacterium HKCCE2091]|nr:hypothetical protein [Rhodobacterales bacterium HKCCE2091]
MTPKVNLHILAARFTQLSRSAYFDPSFREFSKRTLVAIQHVIDNWGAYPDPVVRSFVDHTWAVIRFLHGSRSNDAPHEAQYALQKALRHWIANDVLISSAVLEEFAFFLQPLDLWEHISKTLTDFDTEGYRPLLVRIGSPLAYKNRPIFCVPLFHELGHFVDHHYQITSLSLLVSPPAPPPAGLDKNTWQSINRNHRMEFFADLFSASYSAHAAIESLLAIAPTNPDSLTHPASKKRAAVMKDFLTGSGNPIVGLFQKTLAARGLPPLSAKFKIPNISSNLDDLRTISIEDEAVLFGVFPASWDYVMSQIEAPTAPWADPGVSPYVIEKTVNDLVEKSIRNFETRERWSGAFN